MSESFVKAITPMVPAGAQVETTAQLEARAYNAALGEQVKKVMESKKALLYSPQGLRGLFPTNLCGLKIKKTK